jgi:hypothetical protein
MGLQTEFEFTLPRGFVDQNGNLHRHGVMRLATARDEIDPLRDLRVRGNQAYLVIVLLSRVIVRLGDFNQVTPQMVEDFFAADLAYLQAFYRQINEEGTSRVKVKCASCGSDVEIDLATLGGS